MLSKFDVAVNILPYFSYANKWKLLYKLLSKETSHFFDKHKGQLEVLERMHFGDREKVFELLQELNISYYNEWLCLFYIDISFWTPENISFLQKSKQLMFPRVGSGEVDPSSQSFLSAEDTYDLTMNFMKNCFFISVDSLLVFLDFL